MRRNRGDINKEGCGGKLDERIVLYPLIGSHLISKRTPVRMTDISTTYHSRAEPKMAKRPSIRITSGNRNFYHTVSPFASFNEKLQLTLIPCGTQGKSFNRLFGDETIPRLSVGKGDKRTDSETGGDVPSC